MEKSKKSQKKKEAALLEAEKGEPTMEEEPAPKVTYIERKAQSIYPIIVPRCTSRLLLMAQCVK